MFGKLANNKSVFAKFAVTPTAPCPADAAHPLPHRPRRDHRLGCLGIQRFAEVVALSIFHLQRLDPFDIRAVDQVY